MILTLSIIICAGMSAGCSHMQRRTEAALTGRYQMAVTTYDDGFSILKCDTVSGDVWRRVCSKSGYRSTGWEKVK